MDQLGSSTFSRILLRFGAPDAREHYLPTLRQACAYLEMQTQHRLDLILGTSPLADLDGLLLVDEAPFTGSLPALVLDSSCSMDKTLVALKDFIDPLRHEQERRRALRRKTLLAEAEATLTPVELSSFWDAVETWHWPEPQQELILLRGMRTARENQILTRADYLRDSFSSRFGWYKLWKDTCTQWEG
jgi:hypothetical protein